MADPAQEKNLFNSTERGVIPPSPTPQRDERPAAEKYPPRDDKPALYSVWRKGDTEPLEVVDSALHAWQEFQTQDGIDVVIRAGMDERGPVLATRETVAVENKVWGDSHTVHPETLTDDFKRDLVAEGRNPDNPREPLRAVTQTDDERSAERSEELSPDITADQLRERLAARERQERASNQPPVSGEQAIRHVEVTTSQAAFSYPPRYAPVGAHPKALEYQVGQEQRTQQSSDREAVARQDALSRKDEAGRAEILRERNAQHERSRRAEVMDDQASRERVATREQQSRVDVKRDGDANQAIARAKMDRAQPEAPRLPTDMLSRTLSSSPSSLRAMFSQSQQAAQQLAEIAPPEARAMFAQSQATAQRLTSAPSVVRAMMAAEAPRRADAAREAEQASPLVTQLDAPQRRHGMSR